MSDLVSISMKNMSGSTLSPLRIIACHKMATCVDFAHVLLNDYMEVKRIQRDNKKEDSFVRAVLNSWVSSEGGNAVPITWTNLLDCMTKAKMDGVSIEKIRANVP